MQKDGFVDLSLSSRVNFLDLQQGEEIIFFGVHCRIKLDTFCIALIVFSSIPTGEQRRYIFLTQENLLFLVSE